MPPSSSVSEAVLDHPSTPSDTPSPHRPLSWVGQVARHAFENPRGAALRYNGTTLTWAALDDRARRLAAWLRARGVDHGDRVLVLMTNRVEFAEAVLAVNLVGAIVVPVNFRLSAGEVAYLAQDSGAGVFLVDASLAGVVASVREMVPGATSCLVTGGDSHTTDLDAYDWEQELSASQPDTGLGVEDSREVAIIMYTSGTTGLPKGAMLTYEGLVSQVVTSAQINRLQSPYEVRLVTTPLFHIAALSALLTSMTLGHTVVLSPSGSFDAEGFLDLVEGEQVTNAFLVPTQWELVCASPTIEQRCLRLHTMSWGGAPASREVLRAMAERFPAAHAVSVFGQTEMSPITTVLPGDEAIRKIGSVGRPVPLVSVRIVDTEMNDVPPGEVGEIVYRGPGCMRGYWNNPEATAEAFRGGWFHSGDLVYRDDEGFIYVVDRLKDMIISGGENIYSAEVEAVLATHPKVSEVAVVAKPHPKWGETPVAVVVAKEGQQAPTQEELVNHVLARLASFKKPSQVVVLQSLPRNASGKILKPPLRKMIAELP